MKIEANFPLLHSSGFESRAEVCADQLKTATRMKSELPINLHSFRQYGRGSCVQPF
jgi:hypothetical protein